MIMSILLILAIILGIIIVVKTDSYDDGAIAFGVIWTIVFLVWGVGYGVSILSASHEYDELVAEREAFQSTLTNIRSGENQLETATVAEKIIDWNVKLSKIKNDNTDWYYDCLIDDRTNSINPITIE